MRSVALLLIWVAVLVAYAAAQQASNPPEAGPAEPSGSSAASFPAPGAGEIKAMQSELQQMRSLLSQMETNLPFVASTENPLKHQFELDIEMWGVLLHRWQQRLDALRLASGAQTGEIPAPPAPFPSGPSDARYRFLVDNEYVHASRLELPPGAQASVYQNVHDVVWVAVSSGTVSFADSQQHESAAQFLPGEVRVFPRRQVASVRNHGNAPWVSVVVELKKSGMLSAGCDCQSEVAKFVCGCGAGPHLPELWALSLGGLTLAGTTLSPGQAFLRPGSRGDTLLVAITPLDLRDEAQGGNLLSLAPGSALVIQAGRHQFANRGPSPARFVTLEF